MTLSAEATVSDLRSSIASHDALPSGTVRLLFGGKSLTDASARLSTYSIRPDSTVSLAAPLRGGANRLPRCDYKRDTPDKCTKPIERIVGDCGFCKGHFCSKHRLLESHACEGLEDCKKESHERNADKLNAERTVAIKGI
ncbi:MAG: hypothetical protein INR71_05265 [Terriglobus roseus]|nr:hypothetical protein [Terriglobus roseus]